MAENTQETSPEIPRGNAEGFRKYIKQDIVSGFLVFLIALPLCLGISLACGYPAIAGIFTAIIGSILATFLSNSELTIKGPAAGLIVIAIGCVNDFGGDGAMGGFTAADMTAYRMALAVGVAAAVLQILFSLFRGGILGEFFPLSAVHGMLAAIGVIIIAKQIPIALGVQGAGGEPLEMLAEIPHYIAHMNPVIASIGLVSVLIMFLWPVIGKKISLLKAIPSPMVVLLVAVPMGMAFQLTETHSYTYHDEEYKLGEQYLVTMPDRVFGMFDDITAPDFSALTNPEHMAKSLKWILMFFVIGSLESLLSAKAVDLLDPWKRKTNMDRDMLAVGVGNLCCSLVGGLPMISEIVRSKANIDNGARTRFADLWHGMFLLLCVALIPMILHLIPLAALAAMLVYTGFRLAHPSEFLHAYKVGREQLVIFVVTLVCVLATDLLIGIAIGIAVKLVFHIYNGVPPNSLFKPNLDIADRDENTVMITVHQSAVFSNWIPLRKQIENLGLAEQKNVVIDLSDTQLVDHSVMEKLHELQSDFQREGLILTLLGFDLLQKRSSNHELSARKRGMATLKRLTIVADAALEEQLETEFIKHGATGYTVIPCTGAGRHGLNKSDSFRNAQVRIEIVIPETVCEDILSFLRTDFLPKQRVTACVETVDVVRPDHFIFAESPPEILTANHGPEQHPGRN